MQKRPIAVVATVRGCLGLLLLVAGLWPAAAQTAGGIRGSAYDSDFGVPLPRVRVSIAELGQTTLTTADGNFLFPSVPPGSYSLLFSKSGYERKVVSDVVVTPGELAEVAAELASEVIELEELVVTGTDLLADTELGLLELRADSDQMQDAISQEFIKKAGVSDVAGALKLVVGASVSQGKYATVRGMSDRYTGTTLNGVRIPGADPRRRAVQVDMFPTGTIESVTVTKTFTPDLQADFTGGGVDIKTKSIPDGLILSGSAAIQFNNQSTSNEDFLTYKGGGVSGSISRDLQPVALSAPPVVEVGGEKTVVTPQFFGLYSRNPTSEQQATSDYYDAVTRSFSPVMGTGTERKGAGASWALTAGNVFRAGSHVIGLLGSYSHKHRYDFYDGGLNNVGGVQGVDSDLANETIRIDSQGKDELVTGALGTVVWQPNTHHELALHFVGNSSTDDKSRFQVDPRAAPDLLQNQSLTYTERQVRSTQLHGTHDFPGLFGQGSFQGLLVDWVASVNNTEQEQPDVRFFKDSFNVETGRGSFTVGDFTGADNTFRIWRELEEEDDQLSIDLTVPFAQWTASEGKIKGGYFLQRTDRDYGQNTFTYDFAPQWPNPFFFPAVRCNLAKVNYQQEEPGQLWTDVFLESDRIGIAPAEVTCPELGVTDPATTPAPNQVLWWAGRKGDDTSYLGNQEIRALYAMTELPLTPRLRMIAGVRRATTEINVDPFNSMCPPPLTVEECEETGWRQTVVSLITITDSTDTTQPCDPLNPAYPGQQCTRGLNQNVSQDDPAVKSRIAETDMLPVLNATYQVGVNMNIRGSWARTIARPTFRELAPVATPEFIDGDEFVGNPDLVLSDIENWDLRWEWFRRPGEVLAASVFYKEITNPIEVIAFNTADRNFIQPVNFDSGEVRGFEVEGRAAFGHFSSKLNGLAMGINYTFLDSEVEVPEAQAALLRQVGLAEPCTPDPEGGEPDCPVNFRPLQGQPEFLLNANLTYDHVPSGVSVGLFYNITGDTLLTGAAEGGGFIAGTPDVYERKFRRLDFRVAKRFGRRFAVALKVQNVGRDDRITFYQIPTYLGPDGEPLRGDSPTRLVKSERETPFLMTLGGSYTW